MKRLIPLLLIPLFACSHEHPLTDHQHEHDVPHHDHFNPLGLPFPYIQRVYPPLDVPGFPPFGTLNTPPFDHVDIYFVGTAQNVTLTPKHVLGRKSHTDLEIRRGRRDARIRHQREG